MCGAVTCAAREVRGGRGHVTGHSCHGSGACAACRFGFGFGFGLGLGFGFGFGLGPLLPPVRRMCRVPVSSGERRESLTCARPGLSMTSKGRVSKRVSE